MELMKGYEETTVGVIPADWQVVPITSLIEKNSRITYGVVQPGKDDPRGVEFIRGGDVYDGKIDEENLRKISHTVDAQYSRTKLFGGELLISLVGFPGECAIVPEALKGANIARQVALARLDKGLDFEPDFICHFLRSSIGKKLLLREAFGSAQQVINLKDVNKLELPLPSLLEQEYIATALSDVDALIAGLEKLITKKRDLKQAAMQQLLTGQTRLPGFSGEWRVQTLFELAERKKELFDDGDWIEAQHIRSEGIRLIQTGNIGIGQFLEKQEKKFIDETSFAMLKCKELKVGDLLICRLADPAGRACVMPFIGEARVVTSVDVTIFRPPVNSINRAFLSQVFSMPDWFKKVSDRSGGTTHKRIARGALGRIEVNVPSHAEQTAIATVLSDMDADLSALESRLVKTRAIKQGMMQELLTGRTRLVGNTHES